MPPSSTSPADGGTYTSGSVSNAEATTEGGEPNAVPAADTESCWCSYTLLKDGTATFDTELSDGDTQIALYTGSSLGSLTFVAGDQDSGVSFTSFIADQPATGGVTYHRQVGAWAEANMTYVVRVTGPATTGGGGGSQEEVGGTSSIAC